MDQLMGLIVIAILCYLVWGRKKKSKHNTAGYQPITENKEISPDEVKKAYQKKWMFSYNEKDAYYKLKEITSKHGYTVFAKVRLLDLVEPIKENPKYKTFLWKIQAKHVDYALCDSKLVARAIIELDDNSHDQADRKERDRFVDTVLESCGYRVLHTRNITEEEILKFLNIT